MIPEAPLNIAHVIASLKTGGAEMNLLRLLENSDSDSFRSCVVSLAPEEPMGPRLEDSGVPVFYRNSSSGFAVAVDVPGLARFFNRTNVDVVQTWMYHGDLIGGIAARLARVKALAWGIQASQLDPQSDKTSRKVARVCAPLSRVLPDVIISNSECARETHVKQGYAADKLQVIPSGFDLPKLQPQDRLDVRRELGISEQALVVGRVGRFSPVKDHKTFVAAAGVLVSTFPDVHFLLCGDGVSPQNQLLREWATEAGVSKRLHLLGRRADVARVHSAMDVACSSSYSEGFPTVVGEAMAAGVPVVSTDVGDSAFLIGDTGRIVPARDAKALAGALAYFLGMPPAQRRIYGQLARDRVANCFSIELMAKRYADLYRGLVSRKRVT